jgi:hypothetical protein
MDFCNPFPRDIFVKELIECPWKSVPHMMMILTPTNLEIKKKDMNILLVDNLIVTKKQNVTEE